MAGRKAKPISLILHEGNKSKKTKKEIEERLNAEVKPNTDKIEKPYWLEDDSIACEEWDRIVDELVELELMTNVDITVLASYCEYYSKFVEATQALRKEGLFIEYTNKFGATNVTEHPLVNTQKKAFEAVLKCCTELGLTPSSRAKIAIPKKKEEEPTELDRMFGDV